MTQPQADTLLVVGTGTMGAGIAQIAAAAGDRVYLFDQVEDAANRAVDRIAASLNRAVQKGHVTAQAAESTLQNLMPQHSLDSAAGCAVIIEAVKEDRTVKQQVFRDLEARADESALIATNTSMISITALTSVVRNKGRFCGMHFFNPVPRMKLVEVIAGEQTSAETIAAAAALVRRWGKTPVFAPDSPGFIVNRVFDAIKREALALHEEGVPAAQIDEALRLGLNFPMGPFELMDLIGLDTTYHCLINQAEQMNRPKDFGKVLPGLVAAGKVGRKAKAGFFEYGERR